MKIKLIVIGKTDESYLIQGIQKYIERVKHYVSFEVEMLPDIKLGKKSNVNLQKEKEGVLILSKVKKSDFIILLDEKGKEYDSVGFSKFLQKRMNAGLDLVFVIGCPFGFAQSVYAASHSKLAISQMTFSHQMIRLLFVEQLYRGFSILKGEKYHHV